MYVCVCVCVYVCVYVCLCLCVCVCVYSDYFPGCSKQKDNRMTERRKSEEKGTIALR